MSQPASSTRTLLRAILAAMLLFVGFLLFVDVLGGLISAVGTLLLGWVPFLRRVVPQTQLNWGGVTTAAGCLVGVILLTQYVGRMMSAGWRVKWTVMAVAIVFLMFAAGTAVVGVTHQAVWMTRSDPPLFVYGGISREKANRIKCSANIRQLIIHAKLYASQHGSYPDTLGQLVAATPDIDPETLVCYSGHLEKMDKHNRNEMARNVDEGMTAYVYFGRGYTSQVPDDVPIVTEVLQNHDGDGLNIGFADGRVSWHTPQEAREILQRVRRTPTTQPGR